MASHLHLTRIFGQSVDIGPPNFTQHTGRTNSTNQRSTQPTIHPFNVLNPHPPLSLLWSYLVSNPRWSHPAPKKKTSHLTLTTSGSSSTAHANPLATSSHAPTSPPPNHAAQRASLTSTTSHVARRNGSVRAAETRSPICATSGFARSAAQGSNSVGTRAAKAEGLSWALGVVRSCDGGLDLIMMGGSGCGGE